MIQVRWYDNEVLAFDVYKEIAAEVGCDLVPYGVGVDVDNPDKPYEQLLVIHARVTEETKVLARRVQKVLMEKYGRATWCTVNGKDILDYCLCLDEVEKQSGGR